MKDENLKACMIAKQVLLDTLHIVSSSFDASQGTVKVESSGHLYMPTDEGNGSGSTVRVDSNGIEINSDRSDRKKRRKTITQQSTGLTTGNVALQDEIKGTTPEVAGTTIDEAATKTRQPQLCIIETNEQKQQAKMEVISGNGETLHDTMPTRETHHTECIEVQQQACKEKIMQKGGKEK